MSGSSKFVMTPAMVADQVDPRPVSLWHWGTSKHFGTQTWRSPEFVRANLLPSAEATVRAEGIYFKKMYYICSPEWRTRARNLGSWRIRIAFEPRLVDYIFIREGGKSLEPCRLTDPFYELLHGLDFREAKEYFDRIKEFEQSNRSRKNQSKAELHAQQKDIFDKAQEQNQQAIESQEKSSNAELLRKLRPYREVERTHDRRAGVQEWYGADAAVQESESQPKKQTEYIAPSQDDDILDQLLGDFPNNEK